MCDLASGPEPQRSFLLSGIPSKTERDTLVEKISKLGGRHVQSKNFDDSASHLICGKLSRSEKFVGACITGKWILSPEYIDHSFQVQMWLDEEDYQFSMSDKSQPDGLASAAKRWKWKKTMGSSLPFVDWEVSLHMKSAKKSCFQRILECGGAVTVPFRSKQRTENAAFVLVDSQYYDTILDGQEGSDLLYIREDYVGDYIIKDPEPDLFEYVIGKKGVPPGVISINTSPFIQRQKASSKSVDIAASSSNDPDKGGELIISNNHLCEKRANEVDYGNRNDNLLLSQSTDCIIDAQKGDCVKPRKGKKPLAERPHEMGDSQKPPGNDSIRADLAVSSSTKRKGSSSAEVFALMHSPIKRLRSSQSKPEPLKIFEDKPSIGMKSASLNEKKCNLPKTITESVKIDENVDSCAVMVEGSLDVGIDEVDASSLPPLLSGARHCNMPATQESSLTISVSSVDTISKASDSSSPLDHHQPAVTKNSMHLPQSTQKKNTCIKTQEDPLSQSKRDDILHSTKLTPVKPMQKSLQQFGFLLNSPKTGLKNQGPSPGPKSEPTFTSHFKGTASIKSEPDSSLKGSQSVIASNTLETAIEIDSDSEAEEDKAISSCELSYDDLLKEVTLLCEDNDHSPGAPTDMQSNEELNGVALEEKTYEGISCDKVILNDDHLTDAPSDVQSNEHDKGVTLEDKTYQEICCDNVILNDIQTGKTGDDSHSSENKVDFSGDSTGKKSIQSKDNSQWSEKESFNSGDTSFEKKFKDKFGAEVRINGGPIDISHSHPKDRRISFNECLPSSSRLIQKAPLDSTSYFLHLSSDLSIPLNSMCLNSDRKAYTSSLIPQWMKSSRELNFYSTSLEHGRPDDNLKPLPEVLSELIELVTCEEAWNRNLAFNYLMCWFEANPPTCQSSIRLFNVLFGVDTDQLFMDVLLNSLISTLDSEGHHLLLNFAVAVLEVNFWHLISSGDKNGIQECLLIKSLWKQSSGRIHFCSSVTKVLEAFKSILAVKSDDNNAQSLNSMLTLLGLISECLRLVGSCWNVKNFNILTDSMISFSRETAKTIRNAIGRGDEQSMVLILQGLKPAWFRTLVTASILSDFNDFLVMESIEVSKISLEAIVTQYFFLLPPLTQVESKVKLKQNPVVSQEKLKPSQINVNKRNGKGETKVHVAAIKNDFHRLKELLAIPGVNVNIRDYSNWTPLHEACNHGSLECVELLLNYVPPVNSVFDQGDERIKRVDINARGFVGKTPLHDAIRNNRVEICKLLLKYGGKKLLTYETDDGYSPLDLAKTTEMKDILLSPDIGYYSNDIHSNRKESLFSNGNSNVTENSLPLSSLYNEVLRTGNDELCVKTKDCLWFLSLLNLLISSYMKQTLLKGDNSMDDRDLAVFKNMDIHLNLLQEHLKMITYPETIRDIDFQFRMLKIVASECSL